ncbi:MAG: VOC family protein [Pseudomonadales bacterium]|jgi:lactoylglutathione lyase|nr:VOC family protein [Pseudomonadales bacterium]
MKLGYVNVFVSDLGRAVAFYRDVLGLHCTREDRAFGYAAFTAGAISLGLAEVGPEQETLLERHTGIGFVVEDLDAEHDRLAEAGVVFPMAPERQPWGGYMALFADPDGNVFYLDQA